MEWFAAMLLGACGGPGAPEVAVEVDGTEAALALEQVLPPESPPAPEAAADTGTALEPDEPDEPAGPDAVRAWLAGCDAPDCDVVVNFDADMRTDALPSLSLAPEVAGTWSWRDPRTLVFAPRDGALVWGAEYHVTLAEVLPADPAASLPVRDWEGYGQVPPLRIESKVAWWPVVRGQPRFMGFLNHASLQIGAGPLLVAYDQPVRPADIAAKMRVDGPNGALRFSVAAGPTRVPFLTDELLPAGHVVAVSIDGLDDLDRITVAAPTAEGDGWGEEVWQLEVERTLTLTHEWPDRATTPSGDPLVRLSSTLALHGNTSFSEAGFGAALSVHPEPKTVYASAHAALALVELHLAPGVDYTATVAPELTDALGNRLGTPYVVRFRSRDLPPQLEVPALPVASEPGRSTLEVRAMNVAGLAVQAFPLSPGAYALGTEEAPARCAELHPVGPPVSLVAPAPTSPNELGTVQIRVPGRGLSCVEVGAEGTGSEAAGSLLRTVLVATGDLGVTAKVSEGKVLAWVTRLSDPGPVAGAAVTVLDDGGGTVATGRTGADGVAILQVDAARSHGVAHPLHVAAEAPGDGDVAVVALREDRLSAPWQFGLPGAIDGVETLSAALFTERGAYRPGEAAHVTLLAGPRLAGAEASVTVTDPRGQQLLQRQVKLDAHGIATVPAATAEGAPVGEYTVHAAVGAATTTARYRVEEYRVPTFQVRTRAPETWRIGEPVTAAITAAYLQGGPLDGRAVRWEVLRTPEPFAPDALPGFVFGMGDRSGLAGSVASGGGRLDGAGATTASFTPAHASSAGPVRYTVEGTVTDVDRQAWSGRVSRVVHPASFYVGVRPPVRGVVFAGAPVEVPVVAVAPDGSRVEGANVRVRLERIDHHTTTRLGASGATQTDARPVATELRSCLVQTGKQPVSCTFTVPEAGRWRVRAWAQDGLRRDVQAGFEVTASGSNAAAWPRFDRERIEVVADKPAYAPGDVARLVVETPYDEATGLLTLERDGVLSHRVFTIDRDTPAIEVPLDASHAPNVFATVALLRGRVHDRVDATGFETGAPGFRLGTVQLTVDRSEQRLAATIAPTAPVAVPGETVTAEITLADAAGRPVDGAAVVMVVDEAVLGLTGYTTPDPVTGLYPLRPLGVRTADSRLELPHALRSRREVLFPGGDGGDGLGPLPADLLRSLFESTAFFDAAVPVKAGRASVTFDLPDQTTTFRLMAVAVDGSGRAGSADAALVVRRPLSVAAVTPRFVHPGDRLSVEALVHADHAGRTDVRAELQGLSAVTAASGSVEVARGGTASFPLEVVVDSHAEVAVVRFVAEQGRLQDAVEVRLPVLAPGVARTEVASATVGSQEARLALSLPDDRVRGTERLEVVASTTALTELKDAMGYLMDYPNGCIEQTTSLAYPLVVLEDLLPEIGVEVDRAELRKMSEAGVRRLLSFQTDAGGLSYWPGGTEPHAFGTAFGLTALIAARDKGYDVPEDALDEMARFLEQSLAAGQITDEMPHGSMPDADTRALFVMTLGRLGRPQPAWIERLWTERKHLTPFGLSFLAVAAEEIREDHPLIDPIRGAIAQAAKRSGDEAWFEGDRQRGWSMGSPLRSHAASLLAFSGGGELGGPLLTGLMARRQYGLWGNTQENVFGIMGVHALVGKAGGSAPALSLARNGAAIEIEAMEAPSARVRRQAWTADDLDASEQVVVARRTAGPPVNLTLRASYDVQLTEANRRARSEGVRIERTFETTEGVPLDPASIPLGSLVLVRLKVRTDEAMNYVAIDDRLPAGLEPLNTALATTEKVSLGRSTPAAEAMAARLSHMEVRDHRVAFYADALPAGEWEVRYVARATTRGTFLRPAARAEAMYAPEVYGTTAIDEVTVR